MRTIYCELSKDGVKKAIEEIKQYQREFKARCDLLRQTVAELITQKAQEGFDDSWINWWTPNGALKFLRNADVHVEWENEKGKVSLVIANGEDAVWCEFGTGVYYNGSAGSSRHPKGEELGLTIGSYGKGYGARETWGFYDADGLLCLTHGIPATMPMYKAMQSVCQELYTIALEVFSGL